MAMGACTVTNTRMAAPGMLTAAEPNSKALLVQPDVRLSLLTAAGLQEAREDWSREGQANLAQAIRDELQSRHPVEMLDPATSMEGRTGQLLRLHEAVGQSILLYGPLLPTKKGEFDWTLGEGTKVLREAKGADYAIFVTARGTYASAGRKALMIGAAVLGVGIPLGNQQVYVSLVDLRTGRVVWFNTALAGPQADMRNPEGARSLAADLMKGAPL
jgi:hypothetical protein